MASSKRNSGTSNRVVYSEFGTTPEAIARPAPSLDAAAPQNLKVEVSRKGRKGKTVTIVTGFRLPSDALTELCKKLKAQCGAGGTVKDNDIEIQGDHGQKLLQVLSDLGHKVKRSGG